MWGGVLQEVPALTQSERKEWDDYRRSRSGWVPPHALGYMWDRVDSIHGDA